MHIAILRTMAMQIIIYWTRSCINYNKIYVSKVCLVRIIAKIELFLGYQ